MPFKEATDILEYQAKTVNAVWKQRFGKTPRDDPEADFREAAKAKRKRPMAMEAEADSNHSSEIHSSASEFSDGI